MPQKTKTVLGKSLKEKIALHPGQSGFRVMTKGSESFAMRLALICAAEKTLDLQYYSIHDDTTANLLLEALVRAAKRGVRVRFLIDDISFDEVADTFAMLDSFRHMEVRIFNPFSNRDDDIISRSVRIIGDLESLNHRMHNKALIADNQMAVIGGRNLGDEYFEEHTDVTFRDIDILTAGPITAKISQSFDQYWNSKNTVMLTELRQPKTDLKKREEIRNKLADHWEKVKATDKGKKLLLSPLTRRLKEGDIGLVWARTELVADDPRKIHTSRDDATSKPLVQLSQLLENANKEFIAVSPYFVPREEGVEWLAGLVKRGVNVRVLTNSLASTDVVAVHTGYRCYREALVRQGVELYEMKPIHGKRPHQRLIGKKAPAYASLHSKVYVIDRRIIMIGSFNLDPRSIELNTELALVIYSRKIAMQILAMFNEVTAPDFSYRLIEEKKSAESESTLVWIGTEKGKEVRFHHDPKAGFWRSLEAAVFGLLPIEDQL